MVPADPDTVTPGPSPAAEPRRIPFLAISIALVAVMAGSALFLSGYSLGREAAGEPTIGLVTTRRHALPSGEQPAVPSDPSVAISVPIPSNWPLIPRRLWRYSSDER